MASFLKISVPPLLRIRSALLNAGYQVSGSHCEPQAIKTNAPKLFLWKVIYQEVKKINLHLIYLFRLSKDQYAFQYMNNLLPRVSWLPKYYL